MSRSASKIRDVRSSVKKEMASLKIRRSVSVDTRARGSYVPDKKRPSSEERKSGGNNKLMIRWGGARKSSINLSEVKRKDARPLTDRAYQKRKIADLVAFINELGFNPPMTPAKLMVPTKKDFENVFQFLYKCFDPSYEVKRIEEEGPKILKNLCYPFNVNKSAFVYVARTNWPSLLGVLIWLMDLNKFVLKIDLKHLFETAGDDERAQIHEILLRYICQCHHSEVDNEEEENAVFIKLINSFMNVNVDELMAINEEKKLQLISVEEKINECKQLADHSELLEKNIEKYEDYISKMQSHYQKKNEICDQQLEELKLKESELEALQAEVSKMQDIYDAQGFDGKKHLNYFETQKKELAEKLDKKRADVKEFQDKYWEKEIEFQRRSTEAIDAAKSTGKLYNELIESLKTILDPLLIIKTLQVQKLCGNFHLEFPVWEINFNKRNPESAKSFRNHLENVIEKIKSTDEILKRICSSMSQKLIEIEMKKSEVTTKLKLLSIQENKQEQDLNSKKKIADDEISLLEAQCEKISQAVATLKDEKSELEKLYRAMIEEQNTLIEFREKKEKELKEYLIEQKEMFSYFERIEAQIQELAEEYGNEIATKLQEMRDL